MTLLTAGARLRTSPPAPSGPVVANDTFAGDGPLNGRLATDGEHSWTGHASWATSGGAVTATGATLADQVAILVSEPHEYARISSSMSYSYTDDSNRAHPAIVFRYQDANNYCIAELHGTVMVLRQRVAGVWKDIASPTLPSPVAQHVPVLVTIDLYVDAFCVEVGGTPVASGEPFTFSSPHNFAVHTGIGIRHRHSGSSGAYSRWDDFAVAETTRPILNWPRFWALGARTFPDLTTGPAGTWDSTDINNPNVIPNPAGGWLLSYSGHYNDGVVPGTQVQEMGIAFASSLNGPWTKDPANPSFSETAPQAWNINGGIVYHPSGVYVQVYGTDVEAKQIGVATSTDLNTWVVKPRIGEGHDSTMRLRQDGTTIEAYFKRNDGRFWRAVSTDVGESWTVDPGPFLTAPQWMSASSPSYAEPAFYVPPGKEGEQMIVTFDRDNVGRSTYMAVTIDGGTTWQYMIANKGTWPGGSGDASRFDSFMVANGPYFYLYYAASDTTTPTLNGNIQIGHLRIAWDPSELVRT